MDLKNKVVLITGGTAGIGRALAQTLSAAGARVAITGRHQTRLKEAAQATGAFPIHADVAKEDDVLRTYRGVMEKFGDLDVLVNNAGFGVFKGIAEFDRASFDAVFATNVTGAMMMGREAAKIFIGKKSGNIVNIASTAALRGAANGTAYYSSKFALRGMTECWRAELRKYNIRVFLVNPSEVLTSFFATAGLAQKENASKLHSEDLAYVIKEMLQMDDRGFIPELSVFATNPVDYVLQVYLIDGTYELFRHYFALPSARDRDGREIAAVRGVLKSVLGMIKDGATHLAVATDQVIESFRNQLWPGYKTSAGVAPDLLSQFPLLEETLSAAGVVVWPMVEFEADDALASGAALADADPRVERIVICTPDKDLAQCVRGQRVVQLNRRTRVTLDEAGVARKFGVPPESIPDYLALVGDAADGYPGLPGWGAKSTAAVLAKFRHIESIPANSSDWQVNAANAGSLAATLDRERHAALLFRTLATLRADIPLFKDVDDLRWQGVKPALEAVAARFDSA